MAALSWSYVTLFTNIQAQNLFLVLKKMADKKSRRPLFTDTEIIALVEVEKRAKIITGKLDPGLTFDKNNIQNQCHQ